MKKPFDRVGRYVNRNEKSPFLLMRWKPDRTFSLLFHGINEKKAKEIAALIGPMLVLQTTGG